MQQRSATQGHADFLDARRTFAAALHASWNAIIKAGSDKFNDTVLVTIGAAIIPGLLLPWVPFPASMSRPYLIASVIIHFGYFSLVALAYRAGDMSYAYPIMRGVAPMLTAVAAAFLINEPLTLGAKLGIVLLCSGILTLTSESWWSKKSGFAPTAIALTNAVVISIYTLVDGIGLRLAGDPVSYICWLLFLQPVLLLPYSFITQRARFIAQLKTRWRVCFLGESAPARPMDSRFMPWLTFPSPLSPRSAKPRSFSEPSWRQSFYASASARSATWRRD
jgi:multidrug transporter EmrE-like cation transporter